MRTRDVDKVGKFAEHPPIIRFNGHINTEKTAGEQRNLALNALENV